MRGFGRYSILNQEHARAAAQNAATKVRKEASREVTDRRLERRDREQPVRKVERAEARPSVVEMFDLRPSRPVSADSWSFILPNGPAPGERETGYIARRGPYYQQVREERKDAVRQADATAKMEGADANPRRRNQLIQEILTRRAATREDKQAQAETGKSVGKGAGTDED